MKFFIEKQQIIFIFANMKNLIFHIEYLLHTHNCVIVPNLGGFMLSFLPSKQVGVAEFSAPCYELVFNRELTHNDGLLAESYMKMYGYSFEKATLQIEHAAQELKRELQQQGKVEMGKLGRFIMHDGKRFVYDPDSFIRPDVFGLKTVALKPIIQLQSASASKKSEKNRKAIIKNIGVGTAVAAIIFLALLIFPLSDSTTEHQNAQILFENSFLSELFTKKADGKTEKIESTVVTTGLISSEATTETAVEENNIPTPMEETSSVEEVIPSDTPRYYIVMGVYKNPNGALKAIESLKAEGFNNVSSMKRSNRTDVFVEAFTDKDMADTYLLELHKNYPNHHDAWVLKY